MKKDVIGASDTVTFLATCVTVRRKDGVVLGFTDHVHNLVIDGITYEAQSGYAASAISQAEGLAVGNTEIEGALKSDAITEFDLSIGRYNYAAIEIFQVNYKDLSKGKKFLKSGFLGEVERGDHTFRAEIRGLAEMAQRKIGDVYSEKCRAMFGDKHCRVDKSRYTVTAQVVTVNGDGSVVFFLSAADGYYTSGIMTGLTGNNQGITADIATQIGNTVTPFLTLPYTPQAGEWWQLQAGCDHVFATCRHKFSNYLNFRGEPNIPGTDKIISYPTHK